MKILVAKTGRGDDLVEELREMGLNCAPAKHKRKVRVSRRGRRMRDVWVWTISGMVFCDVDEEVMSRLRWLKGAWIKDDKYVEVSREEVEMFCETLAGVPRWVAGDKVLITLGFLNGQYITVVEDDGKTVKGMIEWDNGLETLVELEWLTPGGELGIK